MKTNLVNSEKTFFYRSAAILKSSASSIHIFPNSSPSSLVSQRKVHHHLDLWPTHVMQERAYVSKTSSLYTVLVGLSTLSPGLVQAWLALTSRNS